MTTVRFLADVRPCTLCNRDQCKHHDQVVATYERAARAIDVSAIIVKIAEDALIEQKYGGAFVGNAPSTPIPDPDTFTILPIPRSK